MKRDAVNHVLRSTSPVKPATTMYAYLFPGQGSQYVGMGQDLYDTSPSAHAVFDEAEHILGFGLPQMCFAGPAEELNDTANTQPALLAVSVAALRTLQERGLERPAYVAGHSMGEFSALVAAGALSFQDGLRLVRERGRLMKQAGERNPGGMAAVIGLERETLEQICTAVCRESGEYVGIANDNCPGQLVISGTKAALDKAMTLAKEQGAKRVIPLAVSIPAHSPLMVDAAFEFRRALDATPFQKPAIPIVANATASPLAEPDGIREALGRQLASPVRWTESVRWMIAQGVTRFVEVGPKDVLTGLLKRIDGTVEGVTTADALARQ